MSILDALSRMDQAIATARAEVRRLDRVAALDEHHLGCVLHPAHPGDCEIARCGRPRYLAHVHADRAASIERIVVILSGGERSMRIETGHLDIFASHLQARRLASMMGPDTTTWLHWSDGEITPV